MIYPQPQQQIAKSGSFTFSIAPADDILKFCTLCKTSDGITFVTDSALAPEEYILDISENGITLTSAAEQGTFRALTSLWQLVKSEGCVLSCTTVHDKPQFERRGYMLDISRCRMPKPDTIKKLIDMLAILKYNEFQLYIESFVFKYDLIPEVTEGFDCLTPDDIHDIEKYCNDRFIDLVPNQNCFGHMQKWLDREEYKHLGVGDGTENLGTINPLHAESTELVDKIFDSLLPHFKSDYVNVGMDEAVGLGKFQLEEPCRTQGTDNVFMDYLNDLNDRIGSRHGKKLQFWADMIVNYPDSFKRIPKGAVALEWDYDLIQCQQMAEHCLALHDKGIDFYVCPSVNTHFTFTGRWDLTLFNLRTAGEVGKKYGAKGYLVTDWGLGGEGHPAFGVWSYVPMALGAQYAWNVGGEQTGEALKPHFIRGAKEFVDSFIFGAKGVAELLCRMGNYYLLEPERIHLGTMCGSVLQFPLSVRGYYYFYDLKECGDDFFFDNVIRYVEDVLSDITKLPIDSQHMREITLNTKMVVLSAELCKVRKNETMDKSKAQQMIELIDWMSEEYTALWLMRNYDEGKQCFLDILSGRKEELLKFI